MQTNTNLGRLVPLDNLRILPLFVHFFFSHRISIPSLSPLVIIRTTIDLQSCSLLDFSSRTFLDRLVRVQLGEVQLDACGCSPCCPSIQLIFRINRKTKDSITGRKSSTILWTISLTNSPTTTLQSRATMPATPTLLGQSISQRTKIQHQVKATTTPSPTSRIQTLSGHNIVQKPIACSRRRAEAPSRKATEGLHVPKDRSR